MTFYQLRRSVLNLLDAGECAYYIKALQDTNVGTKQIFKICNNLLGCNKDLSLPPGTNEELASRFNNFFINKIPKIRELLQNQPSSDYIQPTLASTLPTISEFHPLSEEVCKFVLKSSSKSCEVDPIPTHLLKFILLAVSPILTTVVNSSITSGAFQDNLKEAWVKPLLKKANLDLIDKNYRPVSNLEFQGKLIEQVVTRQLKDHIEKNKLMEPLQSAYHRNHSTATALLKVKSDIINTIANQQIICLVLLDLSAAFDTVDHSTLLARLDTFFGITGDILWNNWNSLKLDKFLIDLQNPMCSDR